MTDHVAALFAEHHASLVRMLFRRTGDRDLAEELAQETFVRALEAPPSSPRSWLFAVALNLVRETWRTQTRRTRLLSTYQHDVAGAADAPDAALLKAERAEGVWRALDQLEERDRCALLLQAEGLSYAEIAEALGLSPGSMGTTLARARKRLVTEYHRGASEGRHAAS